MGSKAVQRQDRWAFGFLLAFLAAIYISPGEWIPGLARFRPALVLSALSTGLMLLGRMGRREKLWVDGQRGVLLLTFCGLAFASLNWSLNPDATQFAAVELLKGVLLYLTRVNLVTTERRLLWAPASRSSWARSSPRAESSSDTRREWTWWRATAHAGWACTRTPTAWR